MSSTVVRVVGAITIVVVSFLVTTFLIERFAGQSDNSVTQTSIGQTAAARASDCNGAKGVELKPPFQIWNGAGFAYVANLTEFKDVADSNDTPTRSKLALCENGKLLGPAHNMHADVSNKGLGRYSHWVTGLVFSASDNSNPNTNGRTYSVVVNQ